MLDMKQEIPIILNLCTQARLKTYRVPLLHLSIYKFLDLSSDVKEFCESIISAITRKDGFNYETEKDYYNGFSCYYGSISN